MDETPRISACSTSPPMKCTRLGMGPLSIYEKHTIINIYKKSKVDAPEKKITHIVSEIVAIMGVAKSTVYRVLKEYKETGEITSAKPIPGRKSKINNESVKNSVKQIIQSFVCKNELPTLNKILNEIKTREDLPQMSRATLYNLLKQINFRYLCSIIPWKPVNEEHGKLLVPTYSLHTVKNE